MAGCASAFQEHGPSGFAGHYAMPTGGLPEAIFEFLMLDTCGERSSAMISNVRAAMEPTLFMFPTGGLSVCFGTATRNPLLFVDTIGCWYGI